MLKNQLQWFASLNKSRAKALFRALAPHVQAIYLIVLKNNERSLSFDQLKDSIPADFKGSIYESDLDTLFPEPQVCSIDSSKALLLVTGSLYLIGAVAERIWRSFFPSNQ